MFSKRISLFIVFVIWILFLLEGCCNNLVGINEIEAANEYKTIVPGEKFNNNKLKYCKVEATGVIKGFKLDGTSFSFSGWSIKGLEKMLGVKFNGDKISDEIAAKIALNIFKDKILYGDRINLDDNIIGFSDLVNAKVLFLKITEKKVMYKNIYVFDEGGPCYVIVVISSDNYVLFKQDIENSYYNRYEQCLLDKVNHSSAFIPGSELQSSYICRRSFKECSIGENAVEVIQNAIPRTSNQMRKDLGYSPLKRGWLIAIRKCNSRLNPDQAR